MEATVMGLICTDNISIQAATRALLRLERTMNLLEGGKEGKGGWGREGGEGTEGRWGREGVEGTWGREGVEGTWAREGVEGTWGREGGWGERGRVGRGWGEEKGRGREGGRGEGGMTVVHILICMFNSNPMILQYLNNNLTWYYVIT